jgi:hypothetical protein
MRNWLLLSAVFASLTLTASAQTAAPTRSGASQPIYQVTIVSRTTKAINYGHRTDPTKIDFKGTELLREAHGDATIQSQRGSVLIDAHFKDLAPPTRFGPNYLTYVVWAITPEGRPQNLGELVLNSSNAGKLMTSTPLQAFAMIVTAEPYFSVSQPSDVVVMENVVRPDTVGKIEEVNATYELLPRNNFTYDPTAPVPPDGPAVSMGEYERTVAMYQAQNAIQHAAVAGADRYAPDKLQKAQQLLGEARAFGKDEHKRATAAARQATQTAEDARVIAASRAAQESPDKRPGTFTATDGQTR